MTVDELDQHGKWERRTEIICISKYYKKGCKSLEEPKEKILVLTERLETHASQFCERKTKMAPIYNPV